MFTDRDKQRFWAKVDQRKPDDCWMWQGFRNPAGYGTFSIKHKMIMAHRYSLGLKLGRAVEHPMMACHTCDNPGCVNPAHLWEGTRSENMRDSMAKGRARINRLDARSHVRGVQHPFAKLNPDAVRHIRSCDEAALDLAERYGVSKALIGMVRRKKIWTDVA